MKQKDIHVVFGRAARGAFVASKEFDLESIQLICLDDILNIGPICDLYSIEDIEKRKDWLLNTLGDNPYRQTLSEVEHDIEAIRSLVEYSELMGNIFIWTGCFAHEVIGTARLLYHLKNCDKNVFIIDFAKVAVKRRIDDMIIYPKTLSILDGLQVSEASKYFNLIDENQIMEWKNIWEVIRKGDSMIRVLGADGDIYEKDETYYDSFLEINCKDEFQSAARVIGHTLCDIDFAVGDGYLNWRLKQLALAGKIESRGELNQIRDYDVRIV